MSVQYSFVLSETINFFELNWIELIDILKYIIFIQLLYFNSDFHVVSSWESNLQ